MERRRGALAVTAAALAALALAAAPTPLGAEGAGAPPAVLDALLPDGRLTRPLAALAEAGGLAPDEGFRVQELGRDARASHHLVWIRDRETPHRHDRHDLLVVVLRGHGHMRLGDAERPVGEGSVLYVPRGTPHAFRNAAGAPAAAYAVYFPPFDGEDRQPVDSP